MNRYALTGAGMIAAMSILIGALLFAMSPEHWVMYAGILILALCLVILACAYSLSEKDPHDD